MCAGPRDAWLAEPVETISCREAPVADEALPLHRDLKLKYVWILNPPLQTLRCLHLVPLFCGDNTVREHRPSLFEAAEVVCNGEEI